MKKIIPNSIELTLKTKYQNQWCLIICKNIQKEKSSFPYLLSIHHDDSREWEETHYLQHYSFLPLSWRIGVVYIPKYSDKVNIRLLQKTNDTPTKISIKICRLSRFFAGTLLAIINPIPMLKTLYGSPKHLKKRLRTALNQNAPNIYPDLSYKSWCDLYDSWDENKKNLLNNSPYRDQWPVIHVQTYIPPDSDYPETIFSLDRQWPTPNKANHSYVAILQNGEILSDHALTVFADQAARNNYPAALYADSDMFDHHNQRSTPHFKPDIGYLTLLSGLLTQDIWLFRKDIFDTYQQTQKNNFNSAYTHRLALATYVWKQQLTIHHIPFVLSHRHISPSNKTIEEMQKIATTDLLLRQWKGSISDNKFPLKVQLFSNYLPISLIIPTTISSKTIRDSLFSIIKNTNHPNFEIILVISQPTVLTRHQRYFLRPFLKIKNLRVIWLKTETFNFSQSCNFGIAHSKYDFVGIVNDDIRPQNPLWLSYMMGHMQDHSVGAVGAKLYYPNGQIQHAGIIMGAANLCEHAGRFQKDNRFNLTYDHDVSAVTGACMLIRRSAYIQVGGFDENYELAYNDVDFCLKLRQINFRIIQCQNAELTHYESLSLGNHYTGKRAGKERQEILSIRSKWKGICDNDPFYNPNLSLQRGMDGKLAFPPRITHQVHKILSLQLV